MNSLRFAGVFAFASALIAVASGDPIYIEDNSGYLGTITTGGAYTNIGMTLDVTGAPVVMGDIAVTAGGALYGTTYQNGTYLYSINTSNAAVTLIGATGGTSFATAGLVFNAAGTLYGNDWNNLVTIDTSTGAETVVGNMGVTTDGDFAFDDLGTLYMTGNSGSLYTVDTGTGAATLVGSMGIGAGVFGLAFEGGGGGGGGGALYGFGSDNSVYTIDRATGAATLDAAFSGLPGGWGYTYGAANAPVPAGGVPALPAAIPMLIGLGGAIVRRRRKA